MKSEILGYRETNQKIHGTKDYNNFNIQSLCYELKRCFDICQTVTPEKDVDQKSCTTTLKYKYSTLDNIS